MDHKGITWAADTYHKFKARCLKVEELKRPVTSFLICFGSKTSFFKDTVKYLEKQVQKAGVSVKTFYAQVRQDLLNDSTPNDDALLHPLIPYRVLDGNTLRQVESVGDEATASYQDGFDFEVIEKSKLEENCILVDGDEHHSFSQGSKKLKSYKEKIYDVLPLKLRSTKKQDACISDHEDLSDKRDGAEGATSSALAMECDKRKPHDHSSGDFAWEFV